MSLNEKRTWTPQDKKHNGSSNHIEPIDTPTGSDHFTNLSFNGLEHNPHDSSVLDIKHIYMYDTIFEKEVINIRVTMYPK